MNPASVSLAYRRMAVQNASPAALVVMLYDTLVGDLSRAIEAMEKGDIEKRSEQIKHGLLVLHQLEGSLDMEKGGEAAKALSRFYTYLRGQLLEAQIKVKPQILKRTIEMVLDVRQAWQQVDAQLSIEKPQAPPVPANTYGAAVSEEGPSSAWSA